MPSVDEASCRGSLRVTAPGSPQPHTLPSAGRTGLDARTRWQCAAGTQSSIHQMARMRAVGFNADSHKAMANPVPRHPMGPDLEGSQRPHGGRLDRFASAKTSLAWGHDTVHRRGTN